MKKYLILLLLLLLALPVSAALIIKINQVASIPAATYKYLDKDSPMYEILSQKKKVIFFSYADHIGADRRYKWLLDRYFQHHPKVYNKYEYLVFEDAILPAKKHSCKTKQCEENALFVACCTGFCIINPKTKQYVYITGHNYGLSKRLIEKYQDW